MKIEGRCLLKAGYRCVPTECIDARSDAAWRYAEKYVDKSTEEGKQLHQLLQCAYRSGQANVRNARKKGRR